MVYGNTFIHPQPMHVTSCFYQSIDVFDKQVNRSRFLHFYLSLKEDDLDIEEVSLAEALISCFHHGVLVAQVICVV